MPLTDAQWARIEPLLPDRTMRWGGRWRDHREVIDAIAFEFQTGTQWVHLPEKYGNWRGVYNRLRMWAVDGTWERVLAQWEPHPTGLHAGEGDGDSGEASVLSGHGG
ncbi:transposase [Streptomyces iranensis]|uniref:transposase n=1 Tax=Streptomyces iranensis TaxID=576784 RepID=UPI0039B72841